MVYLQKAIGQCKPWFQLNLPNVELVPVQSTAHGARLAADEIGNSIFYLKYSLRLWMYFKRIVCRTF